MAHRAARKAERPQHATHAAGKPAGRKSRPGAACAYGERRIPHVQRSANYDNRRRIQEEDIKSVLYDVFLTQYIMFMRLLPTLSAWILFLFVPMQVSADDAFATDVADMRGGSIGELVVRGLSYIGIPYRFGGQSRDSGVDCSALIQQIYREALGFAIPRTTREQAQLGQRVELSRLKAGDLVFFNTRRQAFSHVGMYLGGDRFLHAPSSGGQVRVEQLRKRYWVKRFNGGRRILPHRPQGSEGAVVAQADPFETVAPTARSSGTRAPAPVESWVVYTP